MVESWSATRGSPDPVGARGPTGSCAGRCRWWMAPCRETEHAGGPAGAQHISVVDAVSAGKRGGHQRHQLVAGVGPAWCMAQVQAPVNQLGQAEMQAQDGRKDQFGLATRWWSSKAIRMRSGWMRDSIDWVLLVWGRCSVSKPLSQMHRSTLPILQYADPTPYFGGSGLKWLTAAGRFAHYVRLGTFGGGHCKYVGDNRTFTRRDHLW